MKTFVLAFFAFTLTMRVSIAQTTDETAIKKTIDDQDMAFHAVDYKAYLSYWAKVPYASFLYRDGNYVGDALWKKIEEFWVGRKPDKVNAARTNWNVHITGETAFVTFSQLNQNPDTKAASESFQTRYLEKTNGEWKIVNVTVVDKSSK